MILILRLRSCRKKIQCNDFSYKNKLYAQIGLLVALMGVKRVGKPIFVRVHHADSCDFARCAQGARVAFCPSGTDCFSRKRIRRCIRAFYAACGQAAFLAKNGCSLSCLSSSLLRKPGCLMRSARATTLFLPAPQKNLLHFILILAYQDISQYVALCVSFRALTLLSRRGKGTSRFRRGLASVKREGVVSSPDDVKMQLSVRVYTR